MNLQGLQKLTLLDYPDHMACTLFTGGCNFRCPFCHNGDLVLHSTAGHGAATATAFVPDTPAIQDPWRHSAISHDALFSFLEKRHGILDGVCITGGEPLLQPDLEDLIREIRDLGYLVKLDTNGSFPQKLSHLLERGLIDYVAMDIKNCPERYRETAGLPEHYDLTPIQDSVRLLMGGTVPYEFRTTIVRQYHRPQDVVSMAQWIAGASQYYLQGFVQSENVIKSGLHGLDAVEMDALVPLILPYVPSVQVRGL
ncbi:MAG: anaerobic ribonucleoside-triphosphate reductase activating protein [Lachnospiraceae bacterium]|nr:anaerobic ribonucleoside-triphosphate reductase activating protein [Lachnospiraceae bacterium]